LDRRSIELDLGNAETDMVFFGLLMAQCGSIFRKRPMQAYVPALAHAHHEDQLLVIGARP